MCQDFSCLVTRSYQVAWKRGVSSHDHLETLFRDEMLELTNRRSYFKAEITPSGGYLHPEKPWNFAIDEDEPSWFTAAHKVEAMRAFRKWKKETYALINLDEARNPINPLFGKPRKPTKKDIELLKQWASVRDSVGDSVRDSVRDSVGASVGASVRASVGASVGAYTGSLFNIWDGKYKFQPVVDLWKRGFVASFDEKTWRLHSGKESEIVYELTHIK